MVKPACFVCTNDFDPVQRQPVRITCGHCVCAVCVGEIISRRDACPFRCRSGVRLRYRDVRVVDISVVETTEDNDIPAVLDLNRSLVAYRRMLREVAERNTMRIAQLDSRIAVQQDTLSRFFLRVRASVHEQKAMLYSLHSSENRLRAEVEHESFLLGELASLQTKLRQLKKDSTLNSTLNLDLLSDVACAARDQVDQGGKREDQPAPPNDEQEDSPVTHGQKRPRDEEECESAPSARRARRA
ncbi:hypothetical protein MD484_g8557, partial [Candolleomyces efflorescens]